MLYSHDFKNIEKMNDNEKKKLLKKFDKSDIKDVVWLNDAICISPICLHALGISPGYGTNMVHTRWDLDGPPWMGYHNQTDEDLISKTKYLRQYMNGIDMKIMAKKVLSSDINPHKNIDKILEIANEYTRIFDINKFISKESERYNQFHPSYLLAEYFIGLYAIHYSTLRTTNIFRKIKYLDLVWKAIDDWYWKAILRNYYRYPDESIDNGIKRCKDSITKTMAKGELEIKFKENWSSLKSRLSANDKDAGFVVACETINSRVCGGSFCIMGEDFCDRYKYLLYDDINEIYNELELDRIIE